MSPQLFRTSLVDQTVKQLPTVWETQVQSLDWEDPLENEMATHSRTLAWKIPWMEDPGRLQSIGLQRVRHNWAIPLFFPQLFSNILQGSVWMTHMVKNLLTVQETWVRSLGQEGPLEEEMATHSSILAWRIPRTEEPSGLQSMGSQRVGHDRETNTSTF